MSDLECGKRIDGKDILHMLSVEEQVKGAAQTFGSHSLCLLLENLHKASTLDIRPTCFIESEPESSDEEYEILIEINRIACCDDTALFDEPELLPLPATVEQAQPKTKQTQHKRAPHLPAPLEAAPVTVAKPPGQAVTETRATPVTKQKVAKESAWRPTAQVFASVDKGLAEEQGFLAATEATIFDGAGRVDVLLRRDDMRVACQISITTGKDWELGGIERCFAAGYTDLALICSSDRHLTTLSKFIEENLDDEHRGKVRYVAPEAIPAFLDSLGKPVSTQHDIRDYKVRTTKQGGDTPDTAAIRKAITEVIARSLKSA